MMMLLLMRGGMREGKEERIDLRDTSLDEMLLERCLRPGDEKDENQGSEQQVECVSSLRSTLYDFEAPYPRVERDGLSVA